MDNIPDRIREQKLSLKYRSFMSTIVVTMRQIVGSIVKKQDSGGKWIISEAVVDTETVYIYLYGDEVYEVLKVEFDQMVQEQDVLAEARILKRNLEDMHMKIRKTANIKLAKYLEPLLEVP